MGKYRDASSAGLALADGSGSGNEGLGGELGPGSGGETPGTGGGAAGSPGGAGTGQASQRTTTTAVSPPVDPRLGDRTGVRDDTITIGLFYPKTGAYTTLARHAEAVVQAAFDEAGPIHGRRLVVKGYDDGTANAGTIQVEERRAKDEAFAYLSIIGESNAVLAPLANQHKVPVVIGNIDSDVARPLTYAFAVFSYWEVQARMLPGFIKNELGGAGKKVGIVYENSGTARKTKDVFRREASAAGIAVVSDQAIERNQSTCANQVSNLQQAQAEIVLLVSGPLGGICMLRDANALGYRPTFTGFGASWNLNVVATATGGAANGARTLGTMTTLETPAGRHYAELMRARNIDAEDDDVMLLPYSVARTFIEAVRRTGPNLSRQALVQTFETRMSGFESGFLPPPKFGPGDRTGPTAVNVTACCRDEKWTSARAEWRTSF